MNKRLIMTIGIIIVLLLALAAIGLLNKDSDIDMMDDEMKREDMTKEENDMMNDEMSKNEMNEEESMKEDEVKIMNDGKSAPSFELIDVKGNTYKLSDFAGEKVYVKFWASWCSICLAGLDEIDELSAEMNGFKVVTIVSPDYAGEMNKDDFIEWWAGIDKENILVLLDQDGVISKEYGVRAYPTSAYIGSDGILTKVLPGHMNNDVIKASYDKIH